MASASSNVARRTVIILHPPRRASHETGLFVA
jgi:hypothetical protein